MDIGALKTTISDKVHRLSDPTILEELNEFIDELKKSETSDFWDKLKTSQKQNIEISRKQIKEGKTIPHEQVQQEVKGWLKK